MSRLYDEVDAALLGEVKETTKTRKASGRVQRPTTTAAATQPCSLAASACARSAFYVLEMRLGSHSRAARIAAIMIAGLLLFVASSAAERGVPPAKKAVCTHGVSSIGPVYLRDGKIIDGNTTPHTDACLR
jgi:hypothetical protein